jgi:hypothetical protein
MVAACKFKTRFSLMAARAEQLAAAVATLSICAYIHQAKNKFSTVGVSN